MQNSRKMEGSITIESAVIIPLFTMILMLLVSFTLNLHNRIDVKALEIRREEAIRFSEGKNLPQEAIRAYLALKKLKGGE